jgi:hypothetical protein
MDILTTCRTALARLGTQSSIASLDEDSPEANACTTFYAQALDAALAEIDWRFATRYQALALAGTAPPHWLYQYAIPADCVRVRKILNPRTFIQPQTLPGQSIYPAGVSPLFCGRMSWNSDSPEIPFERGTGADAAGDIVPVLWTNLPLAQLAYTYRADNPGLWEPGFAEAFGWRLAFEMAIAITGKSDLQSAMAEGFQDAVTKAATATGQEGTMSISTVPDMISVRHGGEGYHRPVFSNGQFWG